MTYTNEAMLQGAQFHYEALEKPTDFRKALNISNIYIYIYIVQMPYIQQVMLFF